MYFNIESFINDTTCIILSDCAGGENLFKLNLSDGSMVQMSNYPGRVKHVWHLPERKEFYFEYGDYIRKLNTESFKNEKIFSFKGF